MASAALATVAALLFTSSFLPSAFAAEVDYEHSRSFGHDGSSSSGFSSASSVAVDRNAGWIYVLDRVADAIYKFDLQGNPVDFGGSSPDISGNKLSGFSIEDTSGGRQIAVDSISHRIYVPDRDPENSAVGGTVVRAFKANGEPSEFTAGLGAGTNEIPGFKGLRQVAVDANGAIYTGERGDGTNGSEGFKVFASTGAPLVTDPGGPAAVVDQPNGVAVAPDGLLYIVRSFDKPTRFLPSEYPVTPATTYSSLGDISSKPARALAYEPSLDRLYVAQRYEDAGVPLSRVEVFDRDGNSEAIFGTAGEPGELQEAAGVDVAMFNNAARVFVTHNPEGGLSQVRIFNELLVTAPPAIESTSASAVSGDSATLRGKVNPNNLDTNYWFEYGTEDCAATACTKVPVDGASIAAGRKAVAVQQDLSGLRPQTLYYYRVVAQNDEGLQAGSTKTFTTQSSGLGFNLADSRVWEMVSPPDKHGGSIVLPDQGIVQTAENGNGLAYVSLGSIDADPDGNRAVELSSVLARRDAGVWRSEDITPPHAELTRPRDAEYGLMNPNLSRAFLQARDAAPLSPLTTERTPYIRENSEPPTYTPLLTGAEGFANVAPGTEFGTADLAFQPAGMNADLSTIAMSYPVPMLEGSGPGLYSWSDGTLQAIGVGMVGSGRGSVRNAVSDDGSRIFWAPGNYSASGNDLTALYLYDTAIQENVRLDTVQPGAKDSGDPNPAFQIASADGRVVFFTDSHQLLKGASPVGRDLYRCQIPAGESLAGCATLTDISAPPKGSGESARVKNQALGASEDGSRIYFAAEGVLDTRPNKHGDQAVVDQPNLYLWEEGAPVRFIATLSDGEQANWGEPPLDKGYAVNIVADASPSGRYLAFMSARNVTGYDSVTVDEEPTQQAYRYDAVTEELTCISCNPTGGSPRARLMADEDFLVDARNSWRNRLVSATLPEARAYGDGGTLYRPRTVLDNGRVFFNAFDSLVPADSNGTWDVYQYESTGVGDCSAESGDAATARSAEGCVSLISSGSADEEAAFLDASLSGDDVFFLSTAKLSALDEDTVYDVYDARVDGVAAQLPDLSECQGEACRPQVSAPDDPTPASAGFQGAGNVQEPPAQKKHCPKGKRKVKRKGKVRCVPRNKAHRARHSHRRPVAPR